MYYDKYYTLSALFSAQRMTHNRTEYHNSKTMIILTIRQLAFDVTSLINYFQLFIQRNLIYIKKLFNQPLLYTFNHYGPYCYIYTDKSRHIGRNCSQILNYWSSHHHKFSRIFFTWQKSHNPGIGHSEKFFETVLHIFTLT